MLDKGSSSLVLGFCLGLLLLVTVQASSFTAEDTPLPDAAMTGDIGEVKLLLEKNVDVDQAQGDGMTALHWATHLDDLNLAHSLLEAGASVSPKTRLGALTPLFMASKNGNPAMVELLLDAGADARARNKNGTTSLMMAAASGNIETVQTLLNRDADVDTKDLTNGQTAIMFAAALGRAPAVKLLAKHGADVNAITKVSEIIKPEYRYQEKETENRRRIREGRRNESAMGGMTALHFAAREGHIDVVRELVLADANVNLANTADDMSVITMAIINGHIDLAMFLVTEHGADPNLASKTGLTPLYATIDAQWAARTWYPAPSLSEEKTDYMELVKALVGAGANVNARLTKKPWYRTFHGDWIKQEGATTFWRSAKSNDLTAMKFLIASGANPEIPTKIGGTPLQAATGFGLEPQTSNFIPGARLSTVRYLVEELGADVNAKDDQGYGPLHGAALTADHEAISYLVAAGADITARANMVFGGIGETDKDVNRSTGDTVADMANGPKPHNLQYPETVVFLEDLGSPNSDHCRAATCVVRTLVEKGQQ